MSSGLQNAQSQVDESDNRYLEQLGLRIRRLRKSQGMSRKNLARSSGVSERYLAQIETGTGNISVLLLKQIARALSVRVEELAAEKEIDVEAISVMSTLRTVSRTDRESFWQMFNEWQQNHSAGHQRVALIGLRGAGKSTLGKLVAQQLNIPFLEINEEIQKECGLSIQEVISLYGDQGYRKLAERSISAIKAQYNRVILAVAGGMLVESSAYDSLLGAFHTVWIKASPDEHMARVQAQGDSRPMEGHPQAMQELQEILEYRQRFYMRAEISVDTSSRSVSQSRVDLINAIKGILE